MLKDTRKIAAILAADVVEYSRLMGADDQGALAALKVRRAIFDELVREYDGREFGSVGDSLMAEFPSAVNAVRCAQAIQQSIHAENATLPSERRMQLRIGVNLGDVIEEDGALFGDGVNVAARLQSLAAPGGILIAGAVYEQVRNKLAASFTFIGARQVKNITEPIRVYEVSAPATATLGQRIAALLQRRVVIAAAVYALASTLSVWGLVRLIGTTTAPAWLVPALITLLAAAFVPAMTLVWHSDRRHRAAPWIGYSAATAATVLCCTVVWLAWSVYFDQRAQAAITRSTPKALPVVAVAALQNLTGDPKLDWLREGVANLVRDGLAESSHLIVVSPTRWQTVLRDQEGAAGAGSDVLSSAARAGIDYVVSGELVAAPDGLVLSANLSDVHGGSLIASHRADKLSAQSLLGEAERLVMMAKRGLGIPHTESVASFSADFAVNNMAAYEVYLAGLDYFLHFDYRSAERAFRSALELAPNFHMARYRLAHVEVAGGDTEAGLATLEQIPNDAPLTRRERLYVDGARALFDRDAARAKAIYTTMLGEFPYDVEARLLLALAYDLAIEDDAAVAELKRLLEQEPQNDYVWSYLGETYLRLGDYEHSRQALDQYLKLMPRDPYGFTVLGELEQLTGNLAGAARHFTHALELEPGFVLARLSLARTQVLRGAWDDAERLLRTLAADSETPAAYRIDAAFDLSALLRAQGRFADALQPLQELEPLIQKEYVREAMGLAERGVALAELGRFAEAGELIERAIERSPGVPTRYLFARGSVMLMRGDVAGVRAVAAEVRDPKLPQDSPHDAMVVREAASKAAAYLEGMAELVSGNASEAAAALTRAIDLPGYQYSIYRLGLARALLAEGKRAEALEMARAARAERDVGDIRLDLELDRMRAMLLEAEILAALGQKSAAAARASEFLQRWKGTDAGQPDRVLAERIAGAAPARPGDA
jgi:class 3 adenylate cyclase/tetratricopeptide (TPR) repeat protein/TolB-like protein